MSLRQKAVPVSSSESRRRLPEEVHVAGRTWLIAVLLGAALLSFALAIGFAGSAPAEAAGREGIVSGSAGADELYGNSGSEFLAGGSGDDFIEAKDGSPDYIACGPGYDTASTDASDHAAEDCETVYGG